MSMDFIIDLFLRATARLESIKQYNCLVVALPPDEATLAPGRELEQVAAVQEELLPLLDAYVKQGGGSFSCRPCGIGGFRTIPSTRSI